MANTSILIFLTWELHCGVDFFAFIFLQTPNGLAHSLVPYPLRTLAIMGLLTPQSQVLLTVSAGARSVHSDVHLRYDCTSLSFPWTLALGPSGERDNYAPNRLFWSDDTYISKKHQPMTSGCLLDTPLCFHSLQNLLILNMLCAADLEKFSHKPDTQLSKIWNIVFPNFGSRDTTRRSEQVSRVDMTFILVVQATAKYSIELAPCALCTESSVFHSTFSSGNIEQWQSSDKTSVNYQPKCNVTLLHQSPAVSWFISNVRRWASRASLENLMR